MPQADSDQRPPWWFLPFVLLLFLGLLQEGAASECGHGVKVLALR